MSHQCRWYDANSVNHQCGGGRVETGEGHHAVIQASEVMVGVDEPPSLVAGAKSIEEVANTSASARLGEHGLLFFVIFI